jgi:hypothetical protein
LTARRQGDRPRPSWQTWVPLGLVVVSLLALAVLPDTVARRVARLQQEVAQRVTPVRNELHAFGLAFAREVLAFRAWALTGDAGPPKTPIAPSIPPPAACPAPTLLPSRPSCDPRSRAGGAR